jgi:hypothetical protein
MEACSYTVPCFQEMSGCHLSNTSMNVQCHLQYNLSSFCKIGLQVSFCCMAGKVGSFMLVCYHQCCMSKHTLVDSLHVINPLDSTIKYMVCLCLAVHSANAEPAVSELMQTPKKELSYWLWYYCFLFLSRPESLSTSVHLTGTT